MTTESKGVEMASTELDIGGTDAEEMLRMGGISAQSIYMPARIAPPLDFSRITPSQLGITTKSFTPSTQAGDKSRLSQLKARRRSTIGARGSPETNSLIRYIAQQRRLNPPSTPQQPQASPCVQRGISVLKQKMASFQSLMEVDENQRTEQQMGEGDQKAGSCGRTAMVAMENMVPQPYRKRRCVEVVDKCTEVNDQPLTFDLGQTRDVPEQQLGLASEQTETLTETDSPVPWNNSHSDALPSFQLHCTPTREQQSYSFVSWIDSPGDIGPAQPIAFQSPPPLATCPTPVGDSVPKSKKRVRFGAPLSPEFFDRTLPPSTPLQKGGTPAGHSGTVGRPLRPLLKTPQRPNSPLSQPDFHSPPTSCASPTLCVNPCPEALCDEDLTLKHLENIIPFDEACHSVLDISGDCPPDQALSEKIISQCESPSDQHPARLDNSISEPETVPNPARSLEQPPAPVDPARSRSRKRKQTDENKIIKKRSKRTSAISASGRMKDTLGKKRWGNKKVDRSLYGKRDYASKNPVLSPITETLSSACSSPNPKFSPSPEKVLENGCVDVTTAGGCQTYKPLEGTEQHGKTSAAEKVVPADVSTDTFLGLQLPLCEHRVESQACRMGRGRRKAKTAVISDCISQYSTEIKDSVGEHIEQVTDRHDKDENETRMGSDHSMCGKLEPNVAGPCETPEQDSEVCARGSNREVDGHTDPFTDSSHPTNGGLHNDPDALVICDSDTLCSLHSDAEFVSDFGKKINTNRRSRGQGRPRGRKSSSLYTMCVVDEKVGLGNQEQDLTAAGHQDQIKKGKLAGVSVKGVGSEEEEEGAGQKVKLSAGSATLADEESRIEKGLRVEALLAPWQRSEFLIDEVLQSLPSRQSVRRSLRNQINLDSAAAGLAWLPYVSVSHRPRRRKTEGCPKLSHSEQSA